MITKKLAEILTTHRIKSQGGADQESALPQTDLPAQVADNIRYLREIILREQSAKLLSAFIAQFPEIMDMLGVETQTDQQEMNIWSQIGISYVYNDISRNHMEIVIQTSHGTIRLDPRKSYNDFHVRNERVGYIEIETENGQQTIEVPHEYGIQHTPYDGQFAVRLPEGEQSGLLLQTIPERYRINDAPECRDLALYRLFDELNSSTIGSDFQVYRDGTGNEEFDAVRSLFSSAEVA